MHVKGGNIHFFKVPPDKNFGEFDLVFNLIYVKEVKLTHT